MRWMPITLIAAVLTATAADGGGGQPFALRVNENLLLHTFEASGVRGADGRFTPEPPYVFTIRVPRDVVFERIDGDATAEFLAREHPRYDLLRVTANEMDWIAWFSSTRKIGSPVTMPIATMTANGILISQTPDDTLRDAAVTITIERDMGDES
jgi:hypothetical protein